MENFKYRVSVIVPVYNVSEYLRDCLDSLLAQTIDHDQMEVLLINDGSTDNSLDICYEYAQSHFIFKVFSQENAGVSAARNVGIRNAQGKYLTFLDSDDCISKETLLNVCNFFDENYEYVDVVTYPEDVYINGVLKPRHFRYKYLNKTGIYDLNKTNYALQTRLGIFVKNRADNNLLFDVSIMYHEDQKYIVEQLKPKMKLGFCSNASYRWKRNDDGIMSTHSNPIYVFEIATSFYESLFSNNENVPVYYQAMFIHDLSWKLRTNMLYPYHYDKDEFMEAMNRIKKLLSKVDNSTILNHPGVDFYHKFYFLKLKGEIFTCFATPEKLCLLNNENVIHSQKSIELVLNSIKVINNKLKIIGVVKTVVSDFIQQPELIMSYKDGYGLVQEKTIELFDSAESYYRCKTKTNTMYGFIEEIEAEKAAQLWFTVRIDGIDYDTSFYFMNSCPMAKKTKCCYLDGYYIENNANILTVEKKPIDHYLNNLSDNSAFREEFLDLFQNAMQIRETVWLYYDCRGVEKDNGYYQFIHDINKQDGIKRYYVYANDADRLTPEFKDYRENIVMFGSYKHKVLYLAAKKIITAFIEEKNYNPFKEDEMCLVQNSVCHEIIYLQHGILHAHLPWKYTPGRIACDKIVVSSEFEVENFSKIYHFPVDMLIKSGMPRFDHIERSEKQNNRILFAPSWRNYLIGEAVGNSWKLTESKFLHSNYFNIFNDFLNSEKLENVLKENDVYLDFKIHPIFKPYLQMFDNKNEHVCFANDSVNDEDYSMFITDFSSFVFDFAYLKRPILYFVPDHTEFKAGLNQYRELDLPFEKAFGRLVTDPESAVDEIIRIVENNFIPDPIFKERMDNFYLPMENCCEDIYNSLAVKNERRTDQ